MPSCVAYGCTNRSSRKTPGVTFHRFPKGRKLRTAWVKACWRKDWTPTESSRLCSEHFSEDQIDRTSLASVRLRENAVPNIFRAYPPHLQKIVMNMKPPVKRNTQISFNNVPAKEGTNAYPVSESTTTFQTPGASAPVNRTFADKSAKRNVEVSECMTNKCQKKITVVHQQRSRCKRKIEKMSSLFEDLERNHFLEADALEILKGTTQPYQEFLVQQLSKFVSESVQNIYSPQVRAFALTLHFYSLRAYEYVRETYKTCLPDSRTVSKWYLKINASPGFTVEAFKTVADKVNSSPKLVFALGFDEMTITKHVQFDGKEIHGYVDFGTEVNDDCLPVAKEALVFMLVCINDYWKIPIGYFLIDKLSSLQLANLILQCLTLLHAERVRVVSLTFNGWPVNLDAARHLGCNFDPDSLKTQFKHPESDEYISVFLDTPYLLKCVRNALDKNKRMVDDRNHSVEWKYIQHLHQVQENKDLNLTNKVSGSCVKFCKQKVKTKLATQALSKYVSDSMKFCKDELNLPEFVGCEPVIRFINMFSDLFDILTSRSRMQQNLRKPINPITFSVINQRLTEIEQYISALKLGNCAERIVHCNTRIGFIGFLICIKSVKSLYETLVKREKLIQYFPVHKLSLDHIDLFFRSIRSHEKHSNTTTALQFKSSYKKLLIKSETKGTTIGKCVVLEEIRSSLPVPRCPKPASVISHSSEILECDAVGSVDPILDHDYV